MKIKKLCLLTLFVLVTIFVCVVSRQYYGLATMREVLNGRGTAELTGLRFQGTWPGARSSGYLTDKNLLKEMEKGLRNSEVWTNEVHGKLERQCSQRSPVNIVFWFSNFSSYYPVNARIAGEKYMTLSVDSFDGWPTHFIKLPAPFPQEWKELLKNNFLGKGGK